MVVPDTLWLTTAQAEQVAAHVAENPDEEVCGLLFGRPSDHPSGGEMGNQPPIHRIVPIENISSDRARRYEMHPAQLANAYSSAAASGFELLAIYHSHVKYPPIPSETDVAEAHYPDAVYLIATLIGGMARFAAWSITASEVRAVPLHIGDDLPPVDTTVPALSPPQRFALILSAILAVIFLFAVSLILLPSAPPLPN